MHRCEERVEKVFNGVEDWWESSGELFRHFSVKKVPTNTSICGWLS